MHYYRLPRPELFRFTGISNYLYLFVDTDFYLAIRNTVLFIITCLTVEFFLGLLIALVLSKEFKGIGILRTILIMPILIPTISISILWRLMIFPQMSVINYFTNTLFNIEVNWMAGGLPTFLIVVLIDAWQWSPFIGLILLAGMLGVPIELIEAAKVDGASSTTVFFKIILPYLKPVILIAIILRFLDLIKLFDPIYAVVTGGGSGIETLSVYIYKKGFKVLDIGYGGAVSVIFWVGAFVAANLFVRRFKEYLV
ncbi:MAG: sugar ABC transporter permease [Nitrososphaerales archaeon]